MNHKTMHVLDTRAEEYEAFEVTMKKVACEHEEMDVLYAVAAEVAEELDKKDYKMSSNLPAKASSPHPKSSRAPKPCTTQHART